jgi:hypothetical protein
MRDRLVPCDDDPCDPPDDVRVLAWLERRLVRRSAGTVDLLPGLPRAWAGEPVDVYRLPVGAGELGFALRWHGDRPAFLWQTTAPIVLSSRRLDQSWSTDASRGEALLTPYNA